MYDIVGPGKIKIFFSLFGFIFPSVFFDTEMKQASICRTIAPLPEETKIVKLVSHGNILDENDFELLSNTIIISDNFMKQYICY